MITRGLLLLPALILAAMPLRASDPGPQVPRADAGKGTWTYGPFGYDAAGNIITIDKQYFIYDVNGRLTKASIDRPNPTGTATMTQAHEFAYDEFGNMITGPNAATSLATDPATNHLQVLGAVYDAAGNLVKWTPAGETIDYGYTYDSIGALTEIKVGTTAKRLHVYTADDERYGTYDFGTNTSHWTIRDLGGKVLRDYYYDNVSWTVPRDYFYRDGLLLATVTPTATHHQSLDHLGTPRVVTDASGTRVGFHHYFPFGKEWIDSNDPPGDSGVMKFTGHERDRDPAGSAYDIDYMHARYYGPVMNRFLVMDPGRDWSQRFPQSWNLYAYVQNDPIDAIDPTGMQMVIIGRRERDTSDPGFDHGWFDREYASFLTEAYLFASGAANAFGSNLLLGQFRREQSNPAYQNGQLLGDAAGLAFGLYELMLGLQGGLGGTVLDLTGAGALVGVPVQILSAGVAAHGATTSLISGAHLMSGIKQRKDGSLGQFKGADSKGRENKQVADAMRKAGMGNDPSLRRQVHDALQGQPKMTFQQLVQFIRDYFGR